MSVAERRAISTFLEGAHDLDDVIQRSVRLLAQLTQQVAIVQYPTLARSTVRHVELVQLGAGRLLLVLILSTGRVEQRVIELPAELDVDALADLRSRILRAAVGERITDAAAALSLLTEQVTPDDRSQFAVIAAALVGLAAGEARANVG